MGESIEAIVADAAQPEHPRTGSCKAGEAMASSIRRDLDGHRELQWALRHVVRVRGKARAVDRIHSRLAE